MDARSPRERVMQSEEYRTKEQALFDALDAPETPLEVCEALERELYAMLPTQRAFLTPEGERYLASDGMFEYTGDVVDGLPPGV